MPVEFGLAVENFTPASRRPSGERILAYAGAAESLGYRSLWVWDHLFLGTRRPFPFLEALSTLAALATRTSTVHARHGRARAAAAQPRGPRQGGRHRGPPVGRAAGPRRGRGLVRAGVPGLRRALPGAWPALRAEPRDPAIGCGASPRSAASGTSIDLRGVVMLPPPASRPRPQVLIGGYVDRVLRRVATMGDGWLTYFYTRAELPLGVGEDPRPRRRGGSRPRLAHQRGPAADLRDVLVRGRRPARAGVRRRVLRRRRVEPVHARQRHPRHAGAVRRAARRARGGRRAAHRAWCPCDYALDQVERIAAEVLPALRPRTSPAEEPA